MTETTNQILDILLKIPNIEKRTILGILNPLETEKQERKLLNWLKETKITHTSTILRKSLELGDK